MHPQFSTLGPYGCEMLLTRPVATEDLVDAGCTELQYQATCSWACHEFGVAVEQSPLLLHDDHRQRLVALGMLYLQTYVKLAERALFVEKRPRFKIRPKFHALHCETICRLKLGSKLNPKAFSCFNEEDYVGRCCAIGKASVHTSKLALRIMQRALLQINTWLASL